MLNIGIIFNKKLHEKNIRTKKNKQTSYSDCLFFSCETINKKHHVEYYQLNTFMITQAYQNLTVKKQYGISLKLGIFFVEMPYFFFLYVSKLMSKFN